MMKVNELVIGDLMIGDWVNFLINIEGGDTEYDPVVNEYQPMRVDSVSSFGEVSSELGVINDVSQLQPIPLTPEILEKNGFWREHNIGYVMEKDEYEIIYSLWDHNLRILKNREQILNLDYLDEMCVHELQHALRLCNIEKEIEL